MKINIANNEKIHFIGIGGIGMSGLALIMKDLGFNIKGSDQQNSKNIERLKKNKIKVLIGHKKTNLLNATMVVVSSAIKKNNPEYLLAKKKKIPIYKRGEMLANVVSLYKNIVVAGSHGKTTTTSLIANIFIKAKLDPTYIIGGRILGREDHSILGSSEYLIVEADESDASFLHLSPEVSVITNVDNDHLDFYENNLEKLSKTFHQFLENLPFYGTAIICTDDDKGHELFSNLSRPKISYGFNKSADYFLKDLKQNTNYQEFTLVRNLVGKEVKIQLKIAGRHNALNATAAYIVAKEAGITTKIIKDSLKSFSGVSRRLEFKGELNIGDNKVKLLDDYGHHPTEISATIEAIRSSHKNKNINMIFQPHRYSRSYRLFDDFIDSLSLVDKIIILDIYSAGEQNTQEISSYDFVNSLIKKGKKAFFAKNMEEISLLLESEVKNNEILVTQGAGNIVETSNSLLAKYK